MTIQAHRPRGRRPGRTDTRGAIQAAALALFSEMGYDLSLIHISSQRRGETMSRILSEEFRSKITSADHAAEFISHGMNVGFSGFTGAGYPKALPGALAARIKAAHERGEEFMIGCYTGASTAPELDGVLAEVDGISFRMPYQSDPIMRNKINAGISGYSDIHLSHSGPQTWAGFLGKLDVAVIEVTAITADGRCV